MMGAVLRLCCALLIATGGVRALRVPSTTAPRVAAPPAARLGRRGFAAVGAAALLAPWAPARAGGLEELPTLADELRFLRLGVRDGKVNAKRVAAAVEKTIAPLANGMARNPQNEQTDYGSLIADKMVSDAKALDKALVSGADGFAAVRGSTGDVSYPGGAVEKALASMVENTDAYCKILNCENILIYR